MVLAVNSTKYGFDETVLQTVADMYGECDTWDVVLGIPIHKRMH